MSLFGARAMLIPSIPLEEKFPVQYYYQWVQDHWHFTIYIGTIYLIGIFGGQYYMKNRKPYSLRPYLIAWNLILTIFSILGTSRSLPELYNSLYRGGIVDSICTNDFIHASSITGLWSWLFVMSKWIELGDTAFIVLRKQPLHFLHWFHHIVTMIGVTFCYAEGYAIGRWSGTMNYTIHSVMYGYYALRAMRIIVPKSIAMCITTMQTIQMCVGFVFSFSVLVLHLQGAVCSATLRSATICTVCYFLYFLLFMHYFRMSYFKKTKEIKTQ